MGFGSDDSRERKPRSTNGAASWRPTWDPVVGGGPPPGFVTAARGGPGPASAAYASRERAGNALRPGLQRLGITADWGPGATFAMGRVFLFVSESPAPALRPCCCGAGRGVAVRPRRLRSPGDVTGDGPEWPACTREPLRCSRAGACEWLRLRGGRGGGGIRNRPTRSPRLRREERSCREISGWRSSHYRSKLEGGGSRGRPKNVGGASNAGLLRSSPRVRVVVDRPNPRETFCAEARGRESRRSDARTRDGNVGQGFRAEDKLTSGLRRPRRPRGLMAGAVPGGDPPATRGGIQKKPLGVTWGPDG